MRELDDDESEDETGPEWSESEHDGSSERMSEHDEEADAAGTPEDLDAQLLQEAGLQMTDDDRRALESRALEAKDTGNRYFAQGLWAEAAAEYNHGILCCLEQATRATLYCNLAACQLKQVCRRLGQRGANWQKKWRDAANSCSEGEEEDGPLPY